MRTSPELVLTSVRLPVPGDVVMIDVDNPCTIGWLTRPTALAVAGVITTKPGVLMEMPVLKTLATRQRCAGWPCPREGHR